MLLEWDPDLHLRMFCKFPGAHCTILTHVYQAVYIHQGHPGPATALNSHYYHHIIFSNLVHFSEFDYVISYTTNPTIRPINKIIRMRVKTCPRKILMSHFREEKEGEWYIEEGLQKTAANFH